MMKLRYLAVLAVTGAVLVFTSSATARKFFPTTIVHDSLVEVAPTGTFVVSGHLSSPHPGCRSLRVVTLVGRYPSGSTSLLDIDLTSFLGSAWATKADLTGAERIRATVTKSAFGRRGHRKVCRADTVGFPAP